MKNLLFALTLLLTTNLTVQSQVYKSKDKGCVISFFSSTPMENIEATNNACSSLLITTTDSVAFKVPISGFVFPNSLMQEHFNENYMETPKYPSASFKGKINEKVDYLKDGTYKVTCTGKLAIHGVEQMRTIDGTLSVKGEDISLLTEFNVKLEDHKIEVPKVVFEKIAESILVKVNAQYAPYKKK